MRDGVLYAYVLAPPTKDIVIKTLAKGGILDKKIANIILMGSTEKLQWNQSNEAVTIKLPKDIANQIVIGFKIELK
ncbi:hypothetical protein LXH21_07665 [Flavobacterium algicola]|nr:hypothetical protein [Flavobacterium algicola]